MIDREAIREEAKLRGIPVSHIGHSNYDLVALAAQNDPFYIGTDSHHEAAKWFMELWSKHALTKGTHIRRIHYRHLHSDNPTRANGETGGRG